MNLEGSVGKVWCTMIRLTKGTSFIFIIGVCHD